MTQNEIAKNLLEGKSCDTCEHGYQLTQCSRDLYTWNVLENKFDESTCESWRKRVVFKSKLNRMKRKTVTEKINDDE